MGASGSKARRPLTKEGRLAGTKFDDVELHVISLTYKDLAGLSKGDKGGESIDKATFLQNFPVPGLVGDRLFHALDSNKSGRISFDNFVVGLAVCCRGTLEEKMRFLFGVYDINEDGLIGRDELLLMLNQVPRTLLNIGIEPVDRSALDWGSLALDGESKTTGDGLNPALAMTTPRVGSYSRGGDFFGGGADDGAPTSMPSARGRRRGGGGASLAGGYVTPPADKGPRSIFTNEGIADQALREFGEGSNKSLTFDQFQRWAQSTPAVQALLQGAFPSDAHFSLATSPSARRSTCETLSTFDSPRRSSAVSALPFTTPRRTRESKSAATAISAVAAWSASASARPAPMGGGGGGGSSNNSHSGVGGRQGPPLRLRSMGGEDAFVSSIGGGGGGEQQQPPMGLKTPSRTLSRNTSYGILLRSPLVGHGLRGPAAMSPVPTGFFNAVGGPAGAGEGGGVTATAKARGWGGDESLKTPKPGASGLGRTWGEDELRRADGGKGGGGGGGVRKERERNIPPTPITTGRTRRRTRSASGLVPALRRGQSGSVAAPGLTLDGPSSTPSPPTASAAAATAAAAAGARNFPRQSMSPSRTESGAGGHSGGDDTAAAAGSRPPMSPRGSACGAGGDAGPPPKTPAHPRGGGGANPDRLTPPGTAGVTRKAKKLVVMAEAAAAAAAAAGGDGGGDGGDQQPGTQALLALANAAAVGVAPSTRAPTRGRRLMRYLSHDAGPADGSSPAASNGTARARGFMRMNSRQGPSMQPPGSVPRMGRKKMALRRLNSLSAAAWGARAESVSDSGSRSPPPPPRPPGGRSVPALGGAGGAPAASRNTPTNPVPATPTTDQAFAATAPSVVVTTTTTTSGGGGGGGSVPTASVASPMTDSSPRARASDASGSRIFGSPGYGKNYPAAAAVAAVPARDPVAAIDQQRRGRVGDSPAHGAGAGAVGGHTRGSVSEGGNGAASTTASVVRVPPPMPNTIVLPSTEVRLGLPHSNISPLLKAERGVFPFVPDGAEKDKEDEALQASAGAEAVVRDCLYNSHGMVALDGYLWKPGSIRLVRRWMMLVDNTLYYFVKPGDRKPRGVISLPGCIAEAVSSDEQEPAGEDLAARKEKEPRKSRVPNGYYGLRLFRPNHHGKDSNARLFLAKTAQERDDWVVELRVASRVVPLEDSFQIKALLRKGAFASVHRCVRKDTQEEFAVKIIDKTSLSSHEKFLLRGEIGALKLVSHPNVVRLEAVHEDPRSIAIVMTLCRGGDLWDKVRSQPSRCFTSSQARTVMRPLCEAVLYLHTLGILHRDIKPENILLVDDGDGNLGGVTLSDFGFSHQVSPKSRLACGKQLMGTPSYMAPESILHGMYGKEVDWFSCGCVLYMMLMGRAPFAGNSPSEIFRNTCHGRLGLGRGGASLWDKLPAAARELIVGLMQLDHNLRFTGEQAMEHRWLATPADEELGAAVGATQQQQQQAAQEVRRRRHGSGGSGSRNGSRSGSGSRRGSRSTAGSGAEDTPGVHARSGGGGGGSGSRGDIAGVRPAAAESLKGVPPSSSSTSFATTTPTSSSGSTPGRRGIRGGGVPAGRGTVERQHQQHQQPH